MYQHRAKLSMGVAKMRQNEQTVSAQSNEKRNAYVIEHITDSFFELLAQKPISDISISELTDLAGVGRASFYRNFKRKEDIITTHLNQLFREWLSECNKNNNAPLSEQVRTMITHFETHRSFYTLLNEQGLTYMLKDIIIGFCGPKPEYDMLQAYASSFTAYTIYGWIDVWFQRGMKESSEELYELFKAQGL